MFFTREFFYMGHACSPGSVFYTYVFYNSVLLGHVPSPGIFYTHVFLQMSFFTERIFPPAPSLTGSFFTLEFFYTMYVFSPLPWVFFTCEFFT